MSKVSTTHLSGCLLQRVMCRTVIGENYIYIVSVLQEYGYGRLHFLTEENQLHNTFMVPWQVLLSPKCVQYDSNKVKMMFSGISTD